MAGELAEEFKDEFDNTLYEEGDFDWDDIVSKGESKENSAKVVSSNRAVGFTAVQSSDRGDFLNLGKLPFTEPTASSDETSEETGKHSSQMPIHRLALNDHKAGMQGLDKDRINQIIFEASRGSKYYENEKKKEKRVKEKIKSLNELMQSFTELDYQNARKETGKFVRKAEKERDLSRIIVHIDMDAFYAAVETRDNPALKDIPMAVGSNSMLSTSNYVARKYGVRAAMPGFIAKKLCPNLKIVRENFAKYREVSNHVRKVLAIYDPNFCGMGLDEAYLDLTDYINDVYMNNDGAESYNNIINPEKCSLRKQQLVENTVIELREKIFKETRLTASAGIACNVMLAKVCSDINKPNGQYYLAPEKDTILNFIANLSIRKVSGIGRVSEQMLNEFGVTKCGHLLEKKELLYLLFSEISFQHFIRISLGISSTFVDNDSERKSMSVETTFQEISDPEKVFQVCKDLCESLANDLQKKNLAGKSITVKFKLINFEVKTRTKTILDYVNTSNEIYTVAKEIIKNQMLACKPENLKLRLLGVRVSEFGKKGKSSQNNLDAFLSKAEKVEMDKQACSASYVEVDSLTKTKDIDDSSHSLNDFETFPTCPVCHVPQKANKINSHIDSCLNKQAIKQILSEDYKGVGRNRESGEGNGRKRKGTNEMVVDKASKKITLQSFWKKK